MLEFRLYEPADRDACLRLIREGHDANFSTERFAWLHEQAPAGPSAIALCLEGADVKGIYSVVRKDVRLGERLFAGGRDVDPVVHPSCRGQGVFTRLLDFGLANFEGLDLLFNFANPASAPGFRRKGWKDVTTLDDRVCRLSPHGAGPKDLLLWALTGMIKPRSRGETRELRADEVETLLNDGASRFEAWAPDARLGVERSPDYLAWRYLHHPQHAYRWFLHRLETGAFSLAVCRHEPDLKRLLICDMAGFGASPDLGVWLRLWAELFPDATATTWAPQPPSCLTRFFANPMARGKGLPLLVRPFPGRTTPVELMQPDHWRITPGDLEIT